ncbi:MAG: hypothetical protein GWM92_08615 [Gemmatimonadetes bacterium]|nr:prolipoprotein diacylglyceryl transferase [Gemmatimonadota bacterium]NIR78698.1 prolipoprotein diacylglyceryl transferase [Gemmatimonadota bacterium]NIT87337.1 prolipoprotein diacylglyceryl transferase [Gemmatimonadota bacterium]NIU31181.1 prolipoprotein diacylglyceryl transferase [Gemmatimonadota bacterium]NIU35903.1 hypothetical protein [Gemmatimonadota bacterium]
MYPILFRLPGWIPVLGGEPITSFGAMMLLAFLAAAFLQRAELRRVGLDPDHTWDMLVMAVLGGILGAKLYYLLLHVDLTLQAPVAMALSRGGMVWYGGFLGAAALVVWRIRRSDLPLGTVADGTAPALALAYAVGRVGCFLVGDDYGRPTDSWVGIAFPRGTPPTRVDALERTFGIQVDPALVERFGPLVPVHPTQLYEVVLSSAIFLVLWKIRDHRHRAGWLFMLWLALAGLARFAVEFVRVKDDRLFGPLSLAQVISLGLVAVGVWGARALRGSDRSEPAAAPSPS